MRIYALNTLKAFWNKYPDSEISLLHWHGRIAKGVYNNPQHIIENFKGADYVGNERIVFNICRNKYRLIAAFNYDFQLCYVSLLVHTKGMTRLMLKQLSLINGQ